MGSMQGNGGDWDSQTSVNDVDSDSKAWLPSTLQIFLSGLPVTNKGVMATRLGTLYKEEGV